MWAHLWYIKLGFTRVKTIHNTYCKCDRKHTAITAIPLLLNRYDVIPTNLSAIRSFTCSSTSSTMMSWNKLSYKFTMPGKQPTELVHTQWWLPVCRICTNSLVTTSKFPTGPSVVLWKPSNSGFTCFSKIWACWMMVQSNHPVGDSMLS